MTNPNVAPFAPQVHNEQRITQTVGLSQDTQRGLRGKLIESIMQLVVQAITGVFVPGDLGAAFTQLSQWATDLLLSIPILGPILEWLAQIFGIPLGDVGDPTVNPPDIWSQVVNFFINPLGFFANLISGLIPGSQIPGLDATKITSGNFVESIITDLTTNLNNALGWVAGFVNAFTGQTYTAADVRAGNVTAADAAVTAAAAARVCRRTVRDLRRTLECRFDGRTGCRSRRGSRR